VSPVLVLAARCWWLVSNWRSAVDALCGGTAALMALCAVWVGGTGHYPKNDLVAVESSLRRFAVLRVLRPVAEVVRRTVDAARSYGQHRERISVGRSSPCCHHVPATRRNVSCGVSASAWSMNAAVLWQFVSESWLGSWEFGGTFPVIVDSRPACCTVVTSSLGFCRSHLGN
jgi:hypothetical protein